ncbi:MAG: potassium-transporting ATPase subunit KdpC [Isosphaeraceae bacterium]|nr:potassium-transporting ATPase subunit KdpC [Isosphaeraceae bacterium]
MTKPEETASEFEESGPQPAQGALGQKEAGAASSQPIRAPWRDELRPLLLSIPVLTVLTGVIFPLALAVPARLLFRHQSNGSLLVRDRVVIGSRLIGQADARPGDFHPRPSAAGAGYDATASGGTNLGPASLRLREDVRKLADDYRRENGLSASAPVPVDAVTRSGSGLDPHISPSNAALQVARVARERSLSEDAVRRLVTEHTAGPQFGFLGSPRVSVLELNLALDKMKIFAAPTSER